jgi:hypothetical protein
MNVQKWSLFNISDDFRRIFDPPLRY